MTKPVRRNTLTYTLDTWQIEVVALALERLVASKTFEPRSIVGLLDILRSAETVTVTVTTKRK